MFTPAKNLGRTPPSTPNNFEHSKQNSDQNTEQPPRQLADEAVQRRTEQAQKKRRMISPPELRVTEEEESDILLEILDALDRIGVSVQEKDREKNHVEIQQQVTEAKETIYKNIILLNWSAKKIEIENANLKMKLQQRIIQDQQRQLHQKEHATQTEQHHEQLQHQHRSIAEISHEAQQRHQHRPTYAQLTKTYGELPKKSTSTDSTQNQDWTTPPQTKKFETMIHASNKENTKQQWNETKKEINLEQLQGALKSVRTLSSGTMILESHNEKQKQTLHKVLDKAPDLNYSDIQNSDPMVIVTGLQTGYSEKDIITTIIEENPDLTERYGEDSLQKSLKVIARKKCRNPKKENVIFQVAIPELFKTLVKREFLIFELTKMYVREHVNVVICFKCSIFGHVAKYCSSPPCCHQCGGRHDGKDCASEKVECPNCKRRGISQRQHSARDSNCPAFRRKLQLATQNTNYGESSDPRDPVTGA